MGEITEGEGGPGTSEERKAKCHELVCSRETDGKSCYFENSVVGKGQMASILERTVYEQNSSKITF